MLYQNKVLKNHNTLEQINKFFYSCVHVNEILWINKFTCGFLEPYINEKNT